MTSAGRVTLVLSATAATAGVLTWNSRAVALDAAESRTSMHYVSLLTTDSNDIA